MKVFLLNLTVFLLLAQVSMAVQATRPGVVGQWSGTSHTADEKTRLILDIREQDGKLAASMSLPEVGVTGWPAQTITPEKAGLMIAFPSDSGTQFMQLKQSGEHLTGQWEDPQRKDPARVTLKRSNQPTTVTEERIAITGPVGKLGASLFLPDCPRKCPGVVFLHGSGPQLRDANRFAAQALASRGIAALIFDKRGVGESAGSFEGVRFADLADDGIAAAKHLAALPQVSRVGFAGHSQGGWIAPLAASKWEATAFSVTSAGVAVPPAREAEWDVVYALRHAAVGKNTMAAEAQARQVVQRFHDGIRTGEWQAFENALQVAKIKPWFAKTPLNDFADHSDTLALANYRVDMDYDPLPALHALKVPMLAFLSPDDESTDAVETAGILRHFIRQGKPIQLTILPGYSHSMRRIGPAGKAMRWPVHPANYFEAQAKFMHAAVAARTGK